MAKRTPRSGKCLQELRISRDLTQEELAERAEFSRQLVSLMESGRNPISDAHIGDFAHALQLNEDEISRLKICVEQDRKAIVSDKEFVERVRSLVSGKPGHLYVVSGKPVGFNDRRLMGIAKDAILEGLWAITFLYVKDFDASADILSGLDSEMRDWLLDLEFRTTPETITKTAKDLGCEKKSTEGPVRFVGVSISELADRLSSVTGESSEASFGLEALILLRCLPMFHPHTALSLFKPKSPNLQAESNPENFPVAYLFSRDSTLLESEGQYSWLLLTEAGYQNALRSVENLLSCTSFIKNEYYQP